MRWRSPVRKVRICQGASLPLSSAVTVSSAEINVSCSPPLSDPIRAAVSEVHGLSVSDVRFVPAGAIPRTTSGKIARQACRAEYLRGEFG